MGQTPPLGFLYPLTEGISASCSLVAMPNPALLGLGLGFRRASLPSSARRGSVQSSGLCAVAAWWGVMYWFLLYCGVPPPLVARALPRRRGATATVDRYTPPVSPLPSTRYLGNVLSVVLL